MLASPNIWRSASVVALALLQCFLCSIIYCVCDRKWVVVVWLFLDKGCDPFSHGLKYCTSFFRALLMADGGKNFWKMCRLWNGNKGGEMQKACIVFHFSCCLFVHSWSRKRNKTDNRWWERMLHEQHFLSFFTWQLRRRPEIRLLWHTMTGSRWREQTF